MSCGILDSEPAIVLSIYAMTMLEPCPCGSGAAFDACCGPYLSGAAAAPSAEALMRSRYTAYCRDDIDYLLRSWHPRTRPPASEFGGDSGPRWLGLNIVATRAGGGDDDRGEVEFEARFEAQGKAGHLRERSRFERVDGRWLYVDGEVAAPAAPAPRPGRNGPCPCGSGRKFKHCCGR